VIPHSILRRFYPSVNEHKAVELETFRLLNASLDRRYISRREERLSTLEYMQKHIFSITFLAIYKALRIPRERRIMYGMINHAVRGIVTATDNLLDDEYKEMLPLRFAPRAFRFKSVMHLLLFERFLFQVVDEGVKNGAIERIDRETIHRMLFDAMVPIGAEEASEEDGVREILTPEKILSSIHRYKGGNLLRSAFVVPRFVEKKIAASLETADQGIYRIGMALQVIDDVTDFYEDIRDRRHNYLVSSILHEGNAEEKNRLDRLLLGEGDHPGIEHAYAGTVSRVMGKAFGEAMEGFALLEEAGFWLKPKGAGDMVRHLFRLRKLGHLLALLPAEDRVGFAVAAGG